MGSRDSRLNEVRIQEALWGQGLRRGRTLNCEELYHQVQKRKEKSRMLKAPLRNTIMTTFKVLDPL